jgi:hypothetical protein
MRKDVEEAIERASQNPPVFPKHISHDFSKHISHDFLAAPI